MRVASERFTRSGPLLFLQRKQYHRSYKADVDSESSLWEAYGDPSIRKELPEVQAANRLTEFLRRKRTEDHGIISTAKSPSLANNRGRRNKEYNCLPSRDDYLASLDASMATMALHVHARIAALVGEGFYTIGPCGEESLSTIGSLLRPCDSSALHYRHTAISMARQWKARRVDESPTVGSSAFRELLLGRARGYVVSKHDPVTGGVHCCIGGGENEYVVSSTLASQCPSAVGRALGYSLRDAMAEQRKESEAKDRPISFVTIGDGSLHNHHFLSSITLAKHARHRNIKCPVVFGISDNGFSISYRTHGFVEAFFHNTDENDPLCPVYRVKNAGNMLEIYDVTKQAMDYSRTKQAPSVILYQNLTRRFGHAATDRQFAYMGSEEVARLQSSCSVQASCEQAVEYLGYASYGELSDRWEQICDQTESAFATAIQEPKVGLSEMMDRVSVPLTSIPTGSPKALVKQDEMEDEKPQVMRKQMTRVIDEVMDQYESIVYLGEDVRHGGYYLVTDGLASKHPHRVLDFPPDETTLLGAAMGFSQLGLVPIVEIPYAKYLDCGVDMFYEIAIQHWLTSGGNRGAREAKKYGGMIVRLQGFDRGVFGGNFHTHNALAHIPPGIDLVCFSNGFDYVRGFRHAVWQARLGRIVILVDCTNLLNSRHLHETDRDGAWQFPYPRLSGDCDNTILDFHQVIRYRAGDDGLPVRDEFGDSPRETESSSEKTTSNGRIAIVTYGNGVVTALRARKGLVDQQYITSEAELDVIDCPYLSDVPKGLERLLAQKRNGGESSYDHVLFADICKEGPGSNVLSSMITTLQGRELLPGSWAFVGAPRTYNPLGSTVTFLNCDTIEGAVVKMLGISRGDDGREEDWD